jgi:hypothetical protein
LKDKQMDLKMGSMQNRMRSAVNWLGTRSKGRVSVLKITVAGLYSVIQKDGLNFVRLYFPNYTWYVNDLHNI